ncbi:MAG: hypothetical protein NZ553_12815 [Caldilinea sp.]|nr:hypothetical protein [Caldilinea sp.]MDW8441350.1 hypothetical protein [Caldilineaceae bacterium]
MNHFADQTTLEGRYRLFLLALAAALCIGTPTELWLTGHTDSPLQWIPFALCGLGSLAIAVAWLRPSRRTLRSLQAAMVLLFAGAALGSFEHYEHNVELALEIRPGAVLSDVLFEAMKGANPLLAPGVLALAALLGLAAVYRHPLMGPQDGAASIRETSLA